MNVHPDEFGGEDLPTSPAIRREPEPRPGARDVWPLVIADMHARNMEGCARYGTPLQTNNGRDALVDAYQEALDLAVYLRQLIEERS